MYTQQRTITVAALAGCVPSDADKQNSDDIFLEQGRDETVMAGHSNALELTLVSPDNPEPVTLNFLITHKAQPSLEVFQALAEFSRQQTKNVAAYFPT